MLAASLFCPGAAARAEEIRVGNFAVEGLAGWEPKSFKGYTEYKLVTENGLTALKAESRGAASALIKKINFDPAKYRYLRWTWKIDRTIPQGDEKTKAGDDYAARVYVVFPGTFFWQTRAINYIWANHLKIGEAVPNAFTSNAMMLALETGDGKAGLWVTEERDVLADYKTLFGREPGEAGAIAVMTDTDNTGASANAWYGDIILSTEK